MCEANDNVLSKNRHIQRLRKAGSAQWTLGIRVGITRRDVTSVLTHKGKYDQENKRRGIYTCKHWLMWGFPGTHKQH